MAQVGERRPSAHEFTADCTEIILGGESGPSKALRMIPNIADAQNSGTSESQELNYQACSTGPSNPDSGFPASLGVAF